jgi:hypothetical protein
MLGRLVSLCEEVFFPSPWLLRLMGKLALLSEVLGETV